MSNNIIIGDICMQTGEPGILRSAQLDLIDHRVSSPPQFKGFDIDNDEIWSMDVDLQTGATSSQVFTLTDQNLPPTLTGIVFVVMLQGMEVKRKKRAYMAAQPCG